MHAARRWLGDARLRRLLRERLSRSFGIQSLVQVLDLDVGRRRWFQVLIVLLPHALVQCGQVEALLQILSADAENGWRLRRQGRIVCNDGLTSDLLVQPPPALCVGWVWKF